MKRNIYLIFLVCILIAPNARSQSDSSQVFIQGTDNQPAIYGFVRAGMYGSIDNTDNKPYVSSAFSDLCLRAEKGNGSSYKLYADLRFRYGADFLKPVTEFDLREAYLRINGKRWDMTAGQQIIKWGVTDFTNPVSRLNPQNPIVRSPDPEDMDMGDLILDARWYPVPFLTFEVAAVPFYRSSVLLIDPLPLPDYVTIKNITSLQTDKKMYSYGTRVSLNGGFADISLSWFDGYNPMPGTKLSKFELDLSGPVPVPAMELTLTPYRIRNIGFDFETTAGMSGIRGEATLTIPYESAETYEYIPFREINWVAGFDRSFGDWQIIGEYSGKAIPGFTPSTVDPVIGTDQDMAELAFLMAYPSLDVEGYVRKQVAAFNRLYNYQLKQYYHSAGLKVERDFLYGKLKASMFTLYNFTSRDLLFRPELTVNPADPVTLNAGLDLFSGKKGSLYDITDEFLSCVRFSVKIDF